MNSVGMSSLQAGEQSCDDAQTPVSTHIYPIHAYVLPQLYNVVAGHMHRGVTLENVLVTNRCLCHQHVTLAVVFQPPDEVRHCCSRGLIHLTNLFSCLSCVCCFIQCQMEVADTTTGHRTADDTLQVRTRDVWFASPHVVTMQ